MYTQCLKYRLCPTKAQETVLDRTLRTCRDVYNSLLHERKHDYEGKGTSPSRYEQQKHFPAWSKAESAGRKYVEVNPAWTSQDCSRGGTRVKKTWKERVHFCPNCGLCLDRDTNAARNILKIGMGQHTVSG